MRRTILNTKQQTKIVFFLSILLVFSGMVSSFESSIYEKAISHPLRPQADLKQDDSRKPLLILPFSMIKTGSKVLEIGAGGGYTTELVSRVIGESGHIYAETLSQKRIEGGRLKNVTALRRHKLYQLPDVLAENLVNEGDLDVVIIFFALHDVMMNSRIDQNEFLTNIYKFLKPGGHFIVLDNSAEPDSGLTNTRKLHRIGENFVKEKIISVGFKFDASTNVLRNSNDDLSQSWRPIKGNQDRFSFRFVKSR